MVSPSQAFFWISSFEIPQGFRLFLRPSRSCLYSRDDIIGYTALLISYICPLEAAKSSISENSPLQFVLTLSSGEMLDGARYGQSGGKLCLLCQG